MMLVYTFCLYKRLFSLSFFIQIDNKKNAFHIVFIFSDSLHDGVSFFNINIHDYCCDGQNVLSLKKNMHQTLGPERVAKKNQDN